MAAAVYSLATPVTTLQKQNFREMTTAIQLQDTHPNYQLRLQSLSNLSPESETNIVCTKKNDFCEDLQ